MVGHGESLDDERHHLAGKPQEVVALYRLLEQACLSLEPSAIRRRYLAKTINFDYADKTFCSVHLLQSGLRVWVELRYKDLKDPPAFARDVTHVGHWGVGDTELQINRYGDLKQALPLIQHSFAECKKRFDRGQEYNRW